LLRCTSLFIGPSRQYRHVCFRAALDRKAEELTSAAFYRHSVPALRTSHVGTTIIISHAVVGADVVVVVAASLMRLRASRYLPSGHTRQRHHKPNAGTRA
jgi:hypothetical protein